MYSEFSFQDTKALHKIKVFGIGGGGNNAIDNMIKAGVEGPLFVAANSDLQDLERCLAPHKVQVGTQLTRGLGCGGKAEVGKNAALEDIDRIKEMLADSDLVFITAGMGGGTGSGGAPVVAEALSKVNNPPLIVGVVTKPFQWEGNRRMKQAMEAIAELTANCHSIITVPNDKLMKMMPKGGRLIAKDAYRMADEVLMKAVQGITDLITGSGQINLDFQDLKTVLTKRGPTIMGVGQATGEDRALKATREAINSPLLDDLTITGAKGVLINITGPEDIGLEEVADICNMITDEADIDADIFHGWVIDPSLNETGEVKVTVIATGLSCIEDIKAAEEAVKEAPVAEVENTQPEKSGIINYPQSPEKNGSRLAVGTNGINGGARRNRNLSYYDSIDSFNESIMDTPTYLRRKAD